MCPICKQQSVDAFRHDCDAQRTELLSRYQKERKKLEDMVAARFDSGSPNLGADVGILKQSVLIDSLVVDRMKLDELCARHGLEP